jgi:hypothetical protein
MAFRVFSSSRDLIVFIVSGNQVGKTSTLQERSVFL